MVGLDIADGDVGHFSFGTPAKSPTSAAFRFFTIRALGGKMVWFPADMARLSRSWAYPSTNMRSPTALITLRRFVRLLV